MRVLHLIGGGDIGGAKTAVLSLVKELNKYIEVNLVSFRSGIFTDEARSMGINVVIIDSGNIFNDIKSVTSLVREDQYQIIHSHGSKANMIAATAGHTTETPTVTTVHSDYRLDYLHSIPKRFSYGLINTIALRFIKYHIGVSNNYKKMLIDRKFDSENIFTIYNGIDFDEMLGSYNRRDFASKYGIDLKDDDIVVGILSRLHPVKGLGTFIKAARLVLNQNPKVKFIIGGDGDERKSLEKKAEALSLKNSLYFIGWVNDRYEFMDSIDINVLTSISETFSYVILEGARLKKATISTDVGGISDLVENDKTGYLFNPGDHNKLSEHILKFVNDKGLRDDMGEKVYERARTNFSLENMCKTQLDIYRSIIGRSKSEVQ